MPWYLTQRPRRWFCFQLSPSPDTEVTPFIFDDTDHDAHHSKHDDDDDDGGEERIDRHFYGHQPATYPAPYGVLWQVSPAPYDMSFVNEDMLRYDYINKAFQAVFVTKGAWRGGGGGAACFSFWQIFSILRFATSVYLYCTPIDPEAVFSKTIDANDLPAETLVRSFNYMASHFDQDDPHDDHDTEDGAVEDDDDHKNENEEDLIHHASEHPYSALISPVYSKFINPMKAQQTDFVGLVQGT